MNDSKPNKKKEQQRKQVRPHAKAKVSRETRLRETMVGTFEVNARPN